MRISKLFKALTIHLLSTSLLLAPMPVFSAPARDKDGVVNNNSEWVGSVGGILQQVGGQMQQSKQQQANMRMQANMMRNTRPRSVPAKFFPQCQISPAGISIDAKACQMQRNPAQSIQTARALQSAAVQNIAFFDQLLDQAQSSPRPTGLACLKQAMEGVRSSVQDRVNALERLKEQLAKSNQLFEEQNKAILEEIKRTGVELLGSRSGKLDLNQEAAEYDKLVTPECRDIIGTSKLSTLIYNKGFLGIRNESLAPLNEKAAQHIANKGAYENDLNEKIQQMKTDIKRFGVEGFLKQNGGASGKLSFERNGQERFGSLRTSFTEKSTEIFKEVNNLRANIKAEVGGTSSDLDGLMRFDQNFKADFGDFSNQAERQLKREAITRCVSGPVGLSNDQILSSLRYDSTNISGNTIVSYKEALNVILLQPDSSAAEKQAEIRALDARFQGTVRIVYNDENSVQRNETPYQMFQKVIKKCEVIFDQETDNNVGRSNKKRVTRAKKYMRRLQQIESTFSSDLSNYLIDEVINCSGRKLKAGQCSASSMNTSEPGFCLSQANDCAGQANSCYAQINQQVKKRQAKMGDLATDYNNNVVALITQQEAVLAQVKTQVQRDAEFFKSYFPGANYDYPTDLFVKMPALGEFGALGIELRGEGNIDALKELPGKIALLQNTLLQQWQGGGKSGGPGIEGAIQEYIANQAAAMDRNRQKWQNIKDVCSESEASAMGAIAERQRKAKEVYEKSQGAVNSYCQKFDKLRRNPAAGCSSDNGAGELYEAGIKISSYINDDAQAWVGMYDGLCAMSQNEKKNAEDLYEDDGEKIITNACERGDSNSALREMFAGIETGADHLSAVELVSIRKSTNRVSSPSIREILKKIKSPQLKELIKNYVTFNSDKFKKSLADKNAENLTAIEDFEGSDQEAKKSAAISIVKKLKNDTGFCNETKIGELQEIFSGNDNPSDFKKEMKALGATPKMKNLGRQIASVALSPVKSPLSKFGQQEYQDIDCAAEASNTRFGDFDSFDSGILGGNPSDFLSGLGK